MFWFCFWENLESFIFFKHLPALLMKICMFLQKETLHWRKRERKKERESEREHQFCWKNIKKLILQAFIHFHARKHIS